MKQRPTSTENNDVWLPPPWVRGSWASLLTSHVMTNSERLPPPPLTLAGVTFGAKGRRQISLAGLTSHDTAKAHVIMLLPANPKLLREVSVWQAWTSAFRYISKLPISESKREHVKNLNLLNCYKKLLEMFCNLNETFIFFWGSNDIQHTDCIFKVFVFYFPKIFISIFKFIGV